MSKIEILLIDDSLAFNHLTRLTIKQAGIECTVTEVHNGLRGIEYLKEAEIIPHIILLDINMPVMDGFEFLEEYMAAGIDKNLSHIYMLTSSSQEADKQRALSYHSVKGYFEKPLEKNDLLSIIAGIKNQ